MALNANMMYRLRFIRGLTIKASLNWDTKELQEMAEQYEYLDSQLSILDTKLLRLVNNKEEDNKRVY